MLGAASAGAFFRPMPLTTSLICQRVADFLKSHRPFEFFSENDRLALAAPAGGNCTPFAIFFKYEAGKLYVARYILTDSEVLHGGVRTKSLVRQTVT